MADTAEHDIEEEPAWDAFEVSRHGEDVLLMFSRDDGTAMGLYFSPEDAVSLGIALVQAGQESAEEST